MPDAQTLASIIRCLKDGGVVALPTETIYGICCDARNKTAIERVFLIKGRSESKRVLCVTGSRQHIDALAIVPPAFERIATRYWPGPLTAVLPVRPELDLSPLLVHDERDTIAIRLSPDPLIASITEALGNPLIATSANLADHPFLESAEEIRAAFGDVLDLVVETDHPLLQTPSTIIACDKEGTLTLIREGAIPWSEIQRN